MYSTKDQAGFSMLEVIVSLGIFILLIAAVVEIILFSLHSKDIVFDQLSTQNEARKVVQDLTNEFRSANYSSIGAYPIEMASTTQFIFFTNLDSDTLRERVRYFLATSTLKKGVIKPTGNPLTYNPANEVITDAVHYVTNGTSTVFYYYDQNYTGVESPLPQPVAASQVRVVKISLTLDRNANVSPAPFKVEGEAAARNLKSN